MRRRRSPLTVLLIGAATIVAGSGPTSFAAAPGRAVVTLNPTCQAFDEHVLISDIASVDSGDPLLRARIELLDISNTPAHGESRVVSSKAVEFRLRLAGIDLRNVAIRGTQTEVVGSGASAGTIRATAHSSQSLGALSTTDNRIAAHDRPQDTWKPTAATDRAIPGQTLEEVILSAARRAILQQLPWPEQSVSMELAVPVKREVIEAGMPSDCTCVAHLRSPGSPVGRVNIDVTVKGSDRAPVVVPVSLDVRHYEDVVATCRPVARGKTIQSDDLYLHRWDVTGLTDYCTKLEQVVGKTAGRPMPSLQNIREQDLDRTAAGSAPGQQVVVKRQSRVSLIAKVGDLIITVRGEALQDGKVGDTIRVQNIESKTVLQGRVLSAEEVEIAY